MKTALEQEEDSDEEKAWISRPASSTTPANKDAPNVTPKGLQVAPEDLAKPTTPKPVTPKAPAAAAAGGAAPSPAKAAPKAAPKAGGTAKAAVLQQVEEMRAWIAAAEAETSSE